MSPLMWSHIGEMLLLALSPQAVHCHLTASSCYCHMPNTSALLLEQEVTLKPVVSHYGKQKHLDILHELCVGF